MKKLTVLTSLLFLTLLAFAQTQKGRITIPVVNDKNAPVENATVELRKSTDSSIIKIALSDNSGNAEFENIPYGSYLVRITMTNHKTQYSSIDLNSEHTKSSPVQIEPQATQMQGVTVTSKKPFIQKLSDRIVVNVDNSVVNVGSSAFDVLERSPGVQIDPNDNISLRGRAGVIIMVDGKVTPMSGADLVNYLRGLPSNAIDRIEIITNPSAKYDAAGNSGIIDIRLKKDQRFGLNGTATAGYGQGVYPKSNAGINFNYRNKNMNVFGSYNYAYRVGLNHLFLDRNFYENGVFNGADKKDNYAKMPFNTHNSRLGADFFPSKNTIVGFVVSSNFNHFRRNNGNESVVIDDQKQPWFTFETLARNNDHANNIVGNINFKHTFDTTKREITADFDYGVYKNNSLSSTATSYYNLDGSSMADDYILDGDQDGKLTLKTAKVDYSHPLKKGAKFEAGLKTSFVSSDNDAKFYDVSSGTPIIDVTKTNRFYYDENNNAAYVNYSKEFKKFNFQFGLRSEQTNVKTRQANGDIHWDSSYLQLFPSAFVNYNFKEDQTLGFSVSRRIDRPGYSQLNPFLFLIDVTTYATGNPGLLPQITWSYEMSYTYKNLNFTFGYSHTRDNMNIVIAKFKDVFPDIPSEDNVTVQIPVNLESSDYFGLTIAAPVKVTKWWNMINNADIYYTHFNGNLGGTNLDNGAPSARINVNNTFTFKKGWTAELNGNFNTAGRSGYMVYEPQWGLSAGVQKTVLKGKGTVRLNMTDIFWTNLPKATITYDNYIENWHAYRETRVANLAFTYRFGSNKIQAARRRSTGSEEERRRAGGN